MVGGRWSVVGVLFGRCLRSVFHLVGGRWFLWCSALVGGQCFAFLLVSGRFLVLGMVGGRCLNQYMVGGRWHMVGGLWSVAGRWFCTTPSLVVGVICDCTHSEIYQTCKYLL